MARRLSTLLLLICLCSGTSANAAIPLDAKKALTQYGHDVWTNENGLPQNAVLSMVQTHDGYLWIGTEEGLARFDGVHFTVFTKTNTPEIKHNRIEVLCEGNDGTLWIGSNGGGVVKFKDGEFTSYSTQNGLASNLVSAILVDSEQNLWIGTDRGLNRFRDGIFTTFTTADGLSAGTVGSIFEDSRHELWVGTTEGLNLRKGGKFVSYTTANGLSDNAISCILQSQDGSLLIGTSGGGISRLKDGKFSALVTEGGLPNNNVRVIYEDAGQTVWVGTDGGLTRLVDGKPSTYTVRQGLTSDGVSSICADREGGLWVGTNGGGLDHFTDGKFTTYTTREGLSEDIVRATFQSSDGSLWIGAANGGLNLFDHGRFTSFNIQSIARGEIRSIAENRKGGLWIGTYGGGVYHFEQGKFTELAKGKAAPKLIRAVFESRDGTLWIGDDTGLSRYKDGNFSTIKNSAKIPLSPTFAIIETHDGSLWFGTWGGGLARLKDEQVTTYTTQDGLPSDVIMSLHEDKEGVLWIGTYGSGLARLKDGNFSSYRTSDGLYNDVIFQILEDNNNNLWMGCNDGIFHVNKKELDDFSAKRLSSITSAHYDVADGMKTRECNGGMPAGIRTRDGKLWFPTLKGVAMIDPRDFSTNKTPPPVYIEHVLINKKSVGVHQKMQFQPGSKEIEVQYTAPSFLHPEKVKFKYKLEGFDKDWVDAGTRRVAFYTNLAPGQYRFRVIAANNDGLWNETGNSFEFYLKPHFYQTNWFYALSALVIALSALGLYRLRVSQLKRRTRQLEEVVDQRTQELKQSQAKVLTLEKQATEQLMAGGFAHEMRNALAGPKLLLDQSLGLDGSGPEISLTLANCQDLKDIYLEVKSTVGQDKVQPVLARMQRIFANEESLDNVLQLVRKATNRGLNITQQIMDYSKIGQQERGQTRVNLNDIIQRVVDECQEEFSSQEIAVQCSPNGHDAWIIGDETHFHSILKNLILNARDALIDPSLAHTNLRRIEITQSVERNVFSVVISDNGIGISSENLVKVFEPFFSTKPATGTGLGLGVVRKMVSLYGGKLEVVSELNKGTSMTVSVPISPQ